MSRPAHPTEIRAEGNDDAMRQTLYEFCCRNNKDLLLLQWDTEKNAPDTPQTVSYGSQRKMWWRCEKGHSWQTAVYVRTGGPAAPTAQAGKWDMATTLHRCIRSLPRSGICGKMRRESRRTFLRGASALRGGSVRRGIPGGPRSNPGYPAAAARSVPTGLLWRVRIPWQMSLRSLCVNGMPRKTPH